MTGEMRRNVVVVAVALAIVALILAGGYGIWYLFLRPAGPAAVGAPNVPVATATATPAAASDPAAATTAPAGSSDPLTGGIDGTWKVDTSIGSFADNTSRRSSATGSRRPSARSGRTRPSAGPRTSAGTLTISGSTVTDATIEADLTALARATTNAATASCANAGIQTNQFPTATFKLTSPIDLGSVPADGQEISVTATGQLTLHGVTKDVEIPLKAKLSGDVIAVTGSLPIVFADYGVEAPTSFVVVSIEDHGEMELQLFFTKG